MVARWSSTFLPFWRGASHRDHSHPQIIQRQAFSIWVQTQVHPVPTLHIWAVLLKDSLGPVCHLNARDNMALLWLFSGGSVGMKNTLEQRMRVNHESVYSSHPPIAQSKDVSYTDLVLNSMMTPRRDSPPTQRPNIFPSIYPLLPTLLSCICKRGIAVLQVHYTLLCWVTLEIHRILTQSSLEGAKHLCPLFQGYILG